MKTWITVLCAVALLAGAEKKDAPKVVAEASKVVVDYEKLERRRDGLWYFEEKPFTGVAVMKYPNGQKMGEFTYKDGKPHGLSTMWHENGQKRYEITFKDGKPADGLWTRWYETGQKKEERTFKDGKRISGKAWDKDGKPLGQDQGGGDQKPETKAEALKVVVDLSQLEERDDLWYFKEKLFTGVAVWKHENGQKEFEQTYKDGKLHGLYTAWYENGQKSWELTYKDGKLDGLETSWYSNGQKHIETTYKDGKVISRKQWNKDGNPL